MERETDHGSIAWGNNLMQFKQSRQFECLVKSLFAPVNVLHTAFYDLLHKRGVDTAQGAQLDGVGRIVGLPPQFGGTRSDSNRHQARQRRQNAVSVRAASVGVVMQAPREWLMDRIAEWQAKSKEASNNADLPAFEFAEREIKNYQEMLRRYE